ncbi:YbjN domain-containing protein [Wenjunlia tyrosinilytica]|uniref:YbjN domain-containing protein n=1 Tax=Wenjunlia tyrosinilytica TaxID=1544741 RepID=UPI00166E9F1C|nr:YbjN domain-containing protein [Wenjunlia tyrosinilytica]
MSIDPSSIPNFGGQPNPQQGSGGSPVVQPDQDLVKQLLDQMELKYVVDDDGDLAAPWEGFRVYFMFRGDNNELFAVRTFYDRAYTLDTKVSILEVIDEWNRDTLWPKVYTHTHDDGVVRLIGESQMILTGGVNLEHFVSSTASWVQAAIGFDTWLTERLGLEDEKKPEDGADGGPEGDGEVPGGDA